MSDLSDGLRQFTVDLTAATSDALPNIKKAIGISALKGKRAWQQAARGHRFLGSYPASIDYDPVDSNFSTELGPNPNRRGSSGLGIVEDQVRLTFHGAVRVQRGVTVVRLRRERRHTRLHPRLKRGEVCGPHSPTSRNA